MTERVTPRCAHCGNFGTVNDKTCKCVTCGASNKECADEKMRDREAARRAPPPARVGTYGVIGGMGLYASTYGPGGGFELDFGEGDPWKLWGR